MPLYAYEAKTPESGCAKCRGGFSVQQHLSDPKLEKCPECGAAVVRIVCAPAIGRSKTDLHYRAKRAGFHTLKRVSKGEYEKIY